MYLVTAGSAVTIVITSLSVIRQYFGKLLPCAGNNVEEKVASQSWQK